VPITFRYDKKTVNTHIRLAGVHGDEELLELVQRRPKEAPKPRPAPGKPGEKPEPGKDPEKMPGDKPKQERPKQPMPKPAEPKAPAEARPKADPPPLAVQKMIELRRGYANYHFNLLNRERVWKSASAGADFSNATGTWTLKGTHSRGDTPVEVTLSADKVEGSFPAEKAALDLSKDLDEQLAPSGSGGLLVALHLWRLLLIEGPEKFGDVYYYGTAPQRTIEGQADVLIATRNVVEMRLSFDPAKGRLSLAEMVSDPAEDPCEIEFSDYREVDGRQFPHSMEIRRGEFVYGKLTWTEVKLTSGGAK
jgi:hypothetical protein